MVPSLHPDWTLLLFFAHTHSTVTMTLALIFIPKVTPGPAPTLHHLPPCPGVWDTGRGLPRISGPLGELAPRPQFLHAGSPLREEIAAEVYEDELDMRRSGSCLNSSIASAWSERSLDPDDIRVGGTLRTFF